MGAPFSRPAPVLFAVASHGQCAQTNPLPPRWWPGVDGERNVGQCARPSPENDGRAPNLSLAAQGRNGRTGAVFTLASPRMLYRRHGERGPRVAMPAALSAWPRSPPLSRARCGRETTTWHQPRHTHAERAARSCIARLALRRVPSCRRCRLIPPPNAAHVRRSDRSGGALPRPMTTDVHGAARPHSSPAQGPPNPELTRQGGPARGGLDTRTPSGRWPLPVPAQRQRPGPTEQWRIPAPGVRG